MRNRNRVRSFWTPLLAVGLAAGCGDLGPPGGGVTNGPPPSTAGGEKTAGRSDIETPAPPKQGEILGRVGDNSTNAGIGGRSPEGAAGTTSEASNPKSEAPAPR